MYGENYWHESSGKMCINFAQQYLRNVKINEQNKSLAKGPLYVYTKFEAIWMLLHVPEDVEVLKPMGYRTS